MIGITLGSNIIVYIFCCWDYHSVSTRFVLYICYQIVKFSGTIIIFIFVAILRKPSVAYFCATYSSDY